jgi:hypothetical protein
MGTGTNQYQLVIVIFINKQPIRFNMTLTCTNIITPKLSLDVFSNDCH